LIVTAKGEAKDVLSSLVGIYVLDPKPVNDKSHWLQDSGTNSIWYNKEFKIWAIGPQVNLGSSTASVISYNDVTGPEEATTWQYYDNILYDNKWIISDDIYVEAGTYSNFTFQANKLSVKNMPPSNNLALALRNLAKLVFFVNFNAKNCKL
jgi:hypothetical protein